MSSMPDVNRVIDGIAGRTLPSTLNLASIAAIVFGVAAFAFGLFGLGDGGAWAWGAYLVALVYVLALGQGGIMFSVLLTGTWGRWGRSLKRIGEVLGLFLPIVWLLLLVFVLFGLKIYVWNPATIIPGGPVALAPHSPEAIASKELWLQPGFFIVRQLLALGLLVVLDLVYVRASLRPDLIMAKQHLGAKAPAWWDRIIGGSTDLEATLRASLKTQSRMAPILGAVYALVMSFVAFDLIMSLSPWWYSNMFGGWTFVSAFWVALATIGFVAMVTKDWLAIDEFVTPTVTLDLGKLMLAGCMFWAYTAYAQLLPIWYTDLPEETDYLLVRMYLPQWAWLSQTVAVTCFVAPFTILLSRGVKKMRWPFAAICLLVMMGIFLERTLLVMPSIHFGDTFPVMNFAVVSVGVWVGFLGLMTQVCGRLLASLPPLVVSDPYLETHPWDVHVHSLDAHH